MRLEEAVPEAGVELRDESGWRDRFFEFRKFVPKTARGKRGGHRIEILEQHHIAEKGEEGVDGINFEVAPALVRRGAIRAEIPGRDLPNTEADVALVLGGAALCTAN
jgi:hypothetical protein